jgi:hypothetical protein
MPYRLVKHGNTYATQTIESGKTHGWTTKEKAEAQMRLLEGLMMGEGRRPRSPKVYHKGQKIY